MVKLRHARQKTKSNCHARVLFLRTFSAFTAIERTDPRNEGLCEIATRQDQFLAGAAFLASAGLAGSAFFGSGLAFGSGSGFLKALGNFA